MAGQDQQSADDLVIDELIGLSSSEQAETIADHYASISNLYKPIQTENFPNLKHHKCPTPKVTKLKVAKVIRNMNKKAAAVPGDLPMKLISIFSDQLGKPLAHLED